ncbi:hypothetical protein LWF01_02785 [Saxibacter everestensis]|uniref:Uncharacterized protein n=1 Tax=Saxibacter everestensis TaxID=2909229 RepID=A0ABY8QWS2_9MICO|nr:hypothetical protein LWF01_02785 [Brevibacteriaceae bacterium ZFBP1038]
MTEIKTPDSIVMELTDLKNRVAQGPKHLREAEAEFLEVERQYQREYALAYKRADGPVEDRKQQAIVDTDTFREAKDVALITLNYVKGLSRSYESQQSNLQTQARLVEITYRMAGVGER